MPQGMISSSGLMAHISQAIAIYTVPFTKPSCVYVWIKLFAKKAFSPGFNTSK